MLTCSCLNMTLLYSRTRQHLICMGQASDNCLIYVVNCNSSLAAMLLMCLGFAALLSCIRLLLACWRNRSQYVCSVSVDIFYQVVHNLRRPRGPFNGHHLASGRIINIRITVCPDTAFFKSWWLL
jgi:hypothetical protein